MKIPTSSCLLIDSSTLLDVKDLRAHNQSAKLKALKEQVEVPDVQKDNARLLENRLADRYPSTCMWLFENSKFISWVDTSIWQPILWLCGESGTGKSVLCAAAVDYLRSHRGPSVVAFQFLGASEYSSRNQLLRNLAGQLLDNLSDMGKSLSPDLLSFLNIRPEDSSRVENLIRQLIRELPYVYVFIDGFDEADYWVDRDRSFHYQPQKNEIYTVMLFLLKEAERFPSKLRLWASSQYTSDVESLFTKIPGGAYQKLTLTPEDTRHDILRYLWCSLSTLKRNNSGLNDPNISMGFIKRSMSAEVDGSFLWARTLIESLKGADAYTPSELDELTLTGLTNSLSKLYQNKLEHIQENERHQSPPPWK